MTRPGPNGSPRDQYRLACELCDAEFSDSTTIAVMELHFSVEHPDHDGGIRLVTAWKGKGPEPPRPIQNRAARRHQERKRRK